MGADKQNEKLLCSCVRDTWKNIALYNEVYCIDSSPITQELCVQFHAVDERHMPQSTRQKTIEVELTTEQS